MGARQFPDNLFPDVKANIVCDFLKPFQHLGKVGKVSQFYKAITADIFIYAWN